MLQTSDAKFLPQRDEEPAASAPPSAAELVQLAFGFLRRQIWIIVITLAFATTIGIIFLLNVKPNFSSAATMLIDTRKFQLFQQPTMVGEQAFESSAALETQLEILKSEDVGLTVVKKLHLSEDPEFIGSGGGLRSTLFGSLFGTLYETPGNLSEDERTRRALATLSKRLTVKRISITYVIEITFESRYADRAAEVANAIADSYIEKQLEARFKAMERASRWLENRISELREQATATQRAVVDYKARHNIIDAGGRPISEQRLGELNSQLTVVRAQVSEMRAKLDRIDAILRSDLSDVTSTATVSDLLKNEVVTRLRTRYVDLANRETEWSARYGRNHLAAVNLRNQMREIRTAILDEFRRVGESYRSDYEIAKQREEGIQKELTQAVSQTQAANDAQVPLRELETSARTYQAMYDNFVNRHMESTEQQSFPTTDARVLSRATPPSVRNYKKTLLIFAVAPLTGLLLGFGLAGLREISDRVFRTSKQVETRLSVECISLIPVAPKKRRTSKPILNLDARDTKNIVHDSQNVAWTVMDSPFSRFTEAIRSVKLAGDLRGATKSNKVIGLTSALPAEGKSTLAAALGQMISQVGAKVILVDCDLRNPSLSRALAPNAKSGIVEVVTGKSLLEEVIYTDPVTKLKLLPAPTRSRLVHSHDLLACDAMAGLFETLREQYDYVIVDLSPLAPVVDVRATTHFVDSYVLVIEWGRTKIDVVEHALHEAKGVYENVIGAVLNKVDLKLLAQYDNARAKYYNNKDYIRYGYSERELT